MASLNSVLYFMLYVVKRFVLSVPNLPIVLLTTRTADSLGHTDVNYFPGSFVMSLTWECCLPAGIVWFQISLLLTVDLIIRGFAHKFWFVLSHSVTLSASGGLPVLNFTEKSCAFFKFIE